jgi:hypothetical protein
LCKIAGKCMMMSLNKWNQREIHLEVFMLCAKLWIIL